MFVIFVVRLQPVASRCNYSIRRVGERGNPGNGTKVAPVARFGSFMIRVFKRLRATEVSPINILKLREFQSRVSRPFVSSGREGLLRCEFLVRRDFLL